MDKLVDRLLQSTKSFKKPDRNGYGIVVYYGQQTFFTKLIHVLKDINII